MAKSNMKYGVFALEIIASLLFLAVTFAWLSLSSSGFAGVWQPVLYGAAVVGSISLFLMSIGTLMAKHGGIFSTGVAKAVPITGFALAILTYSNPLAFGTTILGLVLGLIGSGILTAEK